LLTHIELLLLLLLLPAELRERATVATSADEQADITAQLDLLEKKKRLVTKGASSGLQSALRNALFLANPEQLQEEELFDANGGVSPLVAVELAPAVAAPKASKKPAATPLYKMMQSMRAGAAESDQVLVAGDLLPMQQQQAAQQKQQQQQTASSAPAPFMLPAATGFNSFSAVHQDQLLLQQQMAQHMAQMAMHQQLQMNTYMSAPPVAAPAAPAAPVAQYSYDPMFDATPFDELAELLGMGDASDAALAGLALPADFDEDFMMMMETCASGELDEPMVPVQYHHQQQQLPLTMQTGHAVLQQQQQQQYQQFNAAPYMQMQMGWTV
jgi:hypothetical protein